MASRINPWWAANYRLILVLILLVAAVLRLYGLDNVSPPGLEHDEVAHWLINRDILAGNHALYFTDAYGHEAGFHYIQTLFMLFLGDNAFALRLPSAFAGLLLVAVSFTLARRLFGLRVALMSAALLAVLFWPVFYSRLALRAISLPLLSGLSAYFWWKGWAVGRKAFAAESPVGIQRNGDAESFHSSSGSIISSPLLWFTIAGLFAGLSLYTYMASRVVLIFYLLFTTYLLLFHRHALQERWRGVLLFFLTFGVIAAPLTIYLLGHPGAEARIDEVNAPLLALAAGNLRPVATNTAKFLAMFGFSGDPLWRQNVASLPVFDPLLALFFYIGVLISLWRWREPRHLFIILWLFTAAIPSILTIDAPSSIRIINALPILTLFPVIGLEVIHYFRSLSTVFTRLSPKISVFATLIALIILLGLNISRTTTAVFKIWPANEEVQFVWQQALTEAAGYLDSSDQNGPVAIGGWTPKTMDPPTISLTLQREDLSLRYFDPRQSLIIPAIQPGEPSRIVHPAILQIEPALGDLLAEWSSSSHTLGTFEYYEVQESPAIRPNFPEETSFGGEVTFLGYDVLPPAVSDSAAEDIPDERAPLRLVTYWRVDAPSGKPRMFFLHAVNENDRILAQDDALGAPAVHWQAGDTLLQKHTLVMPAEEGPLILRLGLYNPETGRRLLTNNGAEFVLIQSGEETE